MSPETLHGFPIGSFVLRTQVEHLVFIRAPYNRTHPGLGFTVGTRKKSLLAEISPGTNEGKVD